MVYSAAAVGAGAVVVVVALDFVVVSFFASFFSVRCLADYESESVFVHISTESKSEIERYRAASKRLHDPLCWHGISVNLYAQKQIGNKPKQIC